MQSTASSPVMLFTLCCSGARFQMRLHQKTTAEMVQAKTRRITDGLQDACTGHVWWIFFTGFATVIAWSVQTLNVQYRSIFKPCVSS